MGLLSEGSPLDWEETKALAKHVRNHGIEQFINLYARLKDRQGDVLKWGDEVYTYAFSLFGVIFTLFNFFLLQIEYMIVKFDHDNKKAQLSLKAHDILQTLMEEEQRDPEGLNTV